MNNFAFQSHSLNVPNIPCGQIITHHSNNPFYLMFYKLRRICIIAVSVTSRFDGWIIRLSLLMTQRALFPCGFQVQHNSGVKWLIALWCSKESLADFTKLLLIIAAK